MKFFNKNADSENDPKINSENFINLILAACEDPDMKKQISGILTLETFHRTSLVNSMLSHLTLQGAPPELIEAIACLKDEDIAQKAKELINSDTSSQ